MKITLLLTSLFWIIFIFTLSQKLISIGSLLIVRALLIAVLVIYLSHSWFALIMFLIYITGVLVLFRYFIAIRPNTQNTIKKCFKSYIFIYIVRVIISIIILPDNLPPIRIIFEKDVVFIINTANINIYWLIALILLLALLIVVSITYKSPSPLRNFLN